MSFINGVKLGLTLPQIIHTLATEPKASGHMAGFAQAAVTLVAVLGTGYAVLLIGGLAVASVPLAALGVPAFVTIPAGYVLGWGIAGTAMKM